VIDKAKNVERELYGQVCEKVALKERCDTCRYKKKLARRAVREERD
jgi:hypothetical protein